MSSKQLEMALLSLMPAHGSDLPPKLVDLASSLLAQSRHKASTLKAEEEVARQYACANIACDRLKTALDLPPIEPRPPIPPRAYQRLYTYLNSLLLPNLNATPRASRLRTTPHGASSSATTTTTPPPPPSAAAAEPRHGRQSGDTERRSLRVTTPTARAAAAATAAAAAATPTSSGPKTRTTKKAAKLGISAAAEEHARGAGSSSGRSRIDSVYPWVQPVIRYMCAAATEAQHKLLAPSLLAGIEYSVFPQGRLTEDAWVLEHVADLVAALYFFVVMRAQSVTLDVEIDREGYVPLRKEILTLLSRAHQHLPHVAQQQQQQDNDDDDDNDGKDKNDDKAWNKGWRVVKSRDFDAAVAKVNESDWLAGDWYDGIVDAVTAMHADKTRDAVRSGGIDDDDDDHDAGGILETSSPLPTRRADAMLQDRYDYLSDARKADYERWREAMLAKIERAVPASCVPPPAIDID